MWDRHGTGPAEGRWAQDLARRAKIRGQDASIGHGVGGPGRPVRGHGEVTDISELWQGAGVGGALKRVGRCRSGWKLERLPQGSRLGPVEAPWATEPWEAASGGARPSPQTRGCEGAARGFRAWISRRADPSPLRAPPPGRGPAWPAICFASTPTQPPGPPWPQECSGGGGLGLAWRGGGRDRRGPCLSSSAVLPLGVGAGGSGGTLELSKA